MPKSRSLPIRSCMEQRIGDTLAHISELASPVARSCHVGNNTSNVWGWLALVPNTKLVQFDHTRYGLDENCMPWTVMDDDGRIRACYDQDGNAQPEWIGRGINQQIEHIDRRYHAILNYHIAADHHGEDLIVHHVRTAEAIATRLGGQEISFDSAELAGARLLIGRVFRAFASRQLLHFAIDRWVETRGGRGRRARTLSRRIGRFDYRGPDRFDIVDVDGRVVFSGDGEGLASCLHDHAVRLVQRLRYGPSQETVSYPWLTLELSYLFQSVIESERAPAQRIFWHAGGSSSQYYINEPTMRERCRQVITVLIESGLLPRDAALIIIPSFVCQLFACTPQSLAILSDIIATWQQALDRAAKSAAKSIGSTLARLRRTRDPLSVAARALAILDPSIVLKLDRAVRAFNSCDPNRLPVAHVAYRGRPTYNKFGAAQVHFLQSTPRFPAAFVDLRWEEAELLVKVLAQMYAGQSESAPS